VAHADGHTIVFRRVLPALIGALLGLNATSPGALIELNNWLSWVGWRIVTAAFPDLAP